MHSKTTRSIRMHVVWRFPIALIVGTTAIAIPSSACVGYTPVGSEAARASSYERLHQEWERSGVSRETGGDAVRLFREDTHLDRSTLVRRVLERNPTLRSAHFAWRSALERYPQVISLDDPMLRTGMAPLSFGSDEVNDAPMVALSQHLPFAGKRRLRGEMALARAEVAARDFDAARLRIATTASLLFDDYYLAVRSLEINQEHVALLEQFQDIATARYRAGEAPLVEPLQAEVELAHAWRRQVEFETQRAIAMEQLNTLLRRHPDQPLPPPPPKLEEPALLEADAGTLVESALARRPELQATQAQIRAHEASVGLTRREFLPDVTLMTSYDRQWQEDELQPWMGIEINLPLRLDRRRAALAQANAELERARSERSAMEHEVRVQIHNAVQRRTEAQRILELYRDRLLPAARDQIAAARTAFETGRSTFIVFIDAQRNLLSVQLGVEQALAELDRRHAELLRAEGQLPGMNHEGALQ